jgi:hypothetical protein
MPRKQKNNKMAGALVPAFLLIGLGIGIAINQVAPGVMLGLGVGLAAMYFASKGKK